MSTRLKLNIKNVIQGFYLFGDILARHDTRIYSGYSRLVNPDCLYYKQDHVRTNSSNQAEAVLLRSLDNLALKGIIPEIPNISNRLDEVHDGRISIAGCGLPWESPIRFYYDKKPPKCPPPCPKIPKDCHEPPEPPCPPIAKSPKCPTKPKCYPCKRKNPCAKSTSSTLKTFPLYNCRYFSSPPCKPKPPSAKPPKPSPTSSSPARCEPKPCKPSLPRNPNTPKSSEGKGDVCADIPKAPKECYETPGKSAGGGGVVKKGPVCPPSK